MESKKILKGIKWTGIQVVLDTVLRFSVRLILAKLLIPEEFGLIAMCTVFIAVAESASELGMGSALIQRKIIEDGQTLYSTAFWSGIFWGGLIFIIMSFLIAPLAAHFYKEPFLIKIIPFLSLGILFKPFGLIHLVILTRNMEFKKLSKSYNISSLFAGLVGILLAYFDYGVWALVAHQIITSIMPIPLLYFYVKWKPSFFWNRNYFKEIFGFGAYSTGTGIFSTLTYNIDNLMIGKVLGAALLGSYSLSFSLTETVRQLISNVLNKVMFPVFAQSQDDKEKLRSFFLKIININAIVIYPIMTMLILFGDSIITNFFGSKWTSSILPLKILAMAIMTHLLVNSFTSLIRGIGKPKLEMKIIVGLTLFVLIPCLFFGITYYGLTGAAFAILVNKIALVIIGITVLKREIGLTVFMVFNAVKNVVFAIIISALLIIGLKIYFSIQSNLFLVMIYILVYLGIVVFLEKKNIKNLLTKIG